MHVQRTEDMHEPDAACNSALHREILCEVHSSRYSYSTAAQLVADDPCMCAADVYPPLSATACVTAYRRKQGDDREQVMQWIG
jgi:hypothetical protein